MLGERRASRRWVPPVAVAGTVLLLAVLIEPVRVTETSMEPTYTAGDTLLVEKVGVRLGILRRGDVVVMRPPGRRHLVVKRVVGLPGDLVSIEDGVLHVDRRSVSEPFLRTDTVDGVYFGPTVVPERAVFVLGDNRAASLDSRDFGAVGWDRVVGTVIWPAG